MPTLRITPDLGWTNVEDMFDASKNDMLYEKDLAQMDDHSGSVTFPAKARGNLSFDTSAGKKRVPYSDQFHFNGNLRKYYWREDSGEIHYFYLVF